MRNVIGFILMRMVERASSLSPRPAHGVYLRTRA